jgi:putative lipoic acid-binding regulatory protein
MHFPGFYAYLVVYDHGNSFVDTVVNLIALTSGLTRINFQNPSQYSLGKPLYCGP